MSNSNKFGSLWWKDLKEMWALKEWGDNFEDLIKWKIDNGEGIKFWEDSWVGNIALKGKYLRLFSLCVDKDSLLKDCGNWVNGEWKWNLVWWRCLFEWEKIQVCQLSEEVSRLGLVSGTDDWWSRKGSASLEFSMSFAYSLLRGESEGELSYFYKLFWKSKALPATQVTT